MTHQIHPITGCGEQGHIRNDTILTEYFALTSHNNRPCRKLTGNTPSPTNSHIPTGYHPTDTPLPIPGSTPGLAPHTTAQPQQTGTTNNGLWFKNYTDINQPRTRTTVHTPFMNNMSSTNPANMTEAITQILTQVTNNNKK